VVISTVAKVFSFDFFEEGLGDGPPLGCGSLWHAHGVTPRKGCFFGLPGGEVFGAVRKSQAPLEKCSMKRENFPFLGQVHPRFSLPFSVQRAHQ
jgi:hypothetical protein